jgi:hypothetical protein
MHLFGEMEAMFMGIVGNGQTEPVAHEIQVALDGFGGGLHLFGDTLAIRVGFTFEKIEDPLHSNNRRPVADRTSRRL